MESFRRLRPGFTLIELLVVIAIIAVLIALLVPAVQKVREASARAQCSNNLKQLGLALHSHHDVHKQMPAGAKCNAAGAPDPSYGWAISILPYIEQQGLYTQITPETRTFANVIADTPTPGKIHLQSPMAVFMCPSDDDQQPLNNNRPWTATFNMAKSNYPGCAGNTKNNGFFNDHQVEKITFARITDGSSNTFAIGERRMGDGFFAALWAGYSVSGGGNKVWHAILGVTEAQLFTGNKGGTVGVDKPSGFSSRHTNGSNFAMGDGTVRFIQNSINWTESGTTPIGIYNRLGQKDDGLEVGDF